MQKYSRILQQLAKLETILILFLLIGCCKTEILNAPKPIVELVDTTKRVVRTETDTTRKDEPRVPIGWNPSVEDWEEDYT